MMLDEIIDNADWPKYKTIEDPDYKYELLESFSSFLPEEPDHITHVTYRQKLNWNTIQLDYDLDFKGSGKLKPKLYIDKGYQWDGPSGPTLDLASWMRGPLIHDALYSLGRAGLLLRSDRKWADQMMLEILLKDNIWVHEVKTKKEKILKFFHNIYVNLKAHSWYYGVRLFARSSFAKDGKKKW